MPGQYQVAIMLGEAHISGSPFVKTVRDGAVEFASRCSVSGDGIMSGMNTCGHATDFMLQFDCPEEHLGISCTGPDGKPTLIDGMEVEGQENCWRVEYLPAIEGTYEIGITVDGTHIPNSPFKVLINQSIGGRGKLFVFFSSASGKKGAQSHLNRLEGLFLAKGLLTLDNFAPFHAVDLWERDAREELFRVAGSRDLPQVWINDYYVGGVEKLQELEDENVLTMLIEKMIEDGKKPKSDLEDMFIASKMAGSDLKSAKNAIETDQCCIQ
jgi:glutaredoxin